MSLFVSTISSDKRTKLIRQSLINCIETELTSPSLKVISESSPTCLISSIRQKRS